MLITEKYRPRTFADIVPPQGLKEKFNKWKADGKLDCHLIFYGNAGTGKSSTAKAILNELDITDVMRVNGSDNTGVDDARQIIDWASIPSVEGQKVCLIEEFERMSDSAQDSLKFAFEEYSECCRFILTTNNVGKITDPIKSRCECYDFDLIDKASYAGKIVSVCKKEGLFADGNIEPEEQKSLVGIIEKCYPDFRSALNAVNSGIVITDGVKHLTGAALVSDSEMNAYFEPVLLALVEEDIDALMQAIYKIPPAFVFKAYRYMYNNLDLFGDKSKWGKFILTIQKYNYQNQVMVADSDINLAACLIELNQIGKDTGCDL